MLYFKQLLLALLAASLIAGCSSSDDAPDNKAAITAANAKDLAVAATEASKGASGSSDISGFKTGTTSAFDNQAFTKRISQTLRVAANPDLDFSAEICTGTGSGTIGTAKITFSDYVDDTNFTGAMTFANCTFIETLDIDHTIVIDGTISIQGTPSNESVSANLTVTDNGVTETINFSANCSYNSAIGDYDNCTYSSTIVGGDGRTYATADMKVSGDASSGFSISGSVTDPDHGLVTITTTSPLYFLCDNGYPSAGQIVVTGSNGTITVNYPGCDSYTVTFEGVSTTYNWVTVN